MGSFYLFATLCKCRVVSFHTAAITLGKSQKLTGDLKSRLWHRRQCRRSHLHSSWLKDSNCSLAVNQLHSLMSVCCRASLLKPSWPNRSREGKVWRLKASDYHGYNNWEAKQARKLNYSWQIWKVLARQLARHESGSWIARRSLMSCVFAAPKRSQQHNSCGCYVGWTITKIVSQWTPCAVSGWLDLDGSSFMKPHSAHRLLL